jgi:hypothetical protein
LFEAARQPELRETLAASAGRIRALVAERFTALGVAEPEQRARDFLTLIDGLLFNQLVGADRQTLQRPALHRLVNRILIAVGVQQP